MTDIEATKPEAPDLKADVIERFGFDSGTIGNRHRAWWIVTTPDEDDQNAGAAEGDLCVRARDGASNPPDPDAFRQPNYLATAEDGFDCTYRYYWFKPLPVATKPEAAGTEAGLVERVICEGCGSRWTNEDLARERAANPKLLSCCPERKPLTIDGWRDRALAAESRVTTLEAALRGAVEALQDAAHSAGEYMLEATRARIEAAHATATAALEAKP